MACAIVTFARSWHCLAITRSLGRQGIEVFCGEEARFAPCFFSRYCTGSFQYPSVATDPDGFIDFMVEKVKAYFESLEGLSTEALDQSAEKLVREEKRSVALVIAHIAEISRRKADL